MSGDDASFEASWLALRAPADQRARHREPLGAALSHLARDGGRVAEASDPPLIVDIGCGAGAALEAVRSPRAVWRLLDQDAALLERAKRRAEALGVRIETLRIDLAAVDPAALRGLLEDADLITASAFFDLASAAWIERFVAALPAKAAVYAALSYSGDMRWRPEHPDDAAILRAFNDHQQGEKGFGPALGPLAAAHLVERLAAAGRETRTARSDWVLEADRDGALMLELAQGVAKAAAELGLDTEDWSNSRPAIREAKVSHLDVFAAPLPGTSS